MFNLRTVFVLTVVVVISIHCEDEKNQKGDIPIPANNGSSNDTTKSPDDTPFVVNNQTETPIIISTLPDITTQSTAPTTTVPTTTTNGTTTTTSTTPIPTSKTTSTEAPTTTSVPTSTTTATTTDAPTPSPSPKTTTTAKPVVPTTTEPPPHKDRHFDGASFIGGIILAVGLMGISFIAFKFYKARTDRNYHTL